MATHRLVPFRRLFFILALALVALPIFPACLIFAHAGTMMVTNGAPDPRAVEAQRRLILSHRRREQIQENAERSRRLTASQESGVVADIARRSRHRAVSMHRSTTPQGRRAVRAAASHVTSQ
jgi:hypothetical protein